ncbi:MAG: hypothetical protein WA144_14815 [Candidatus Methanoperedens sp.]
MFLGISNVIQILESNNRIQPALPHINIPIRLNVPADCQEKFIAGLSVGYVFLPNT